MTTFLWRVRLRVTARVALTRVLGAVPGWVPEAVRRSYASSSGRRRQALHRLVAVLRHRTLAPVEDFSLSDNPRIRLAAVDNAVVKSLYWYGEHGWEGIETDWWRRFCRQSTCIVEAGANVGYYTVQGALVAPHARYVAVEPHPESAAILRRNVALNQLDNVQVVEAAVVGSGTPGPVELALPDHERYVAPTGAYLVDLREGINDRPARRAVTVPTIDMGELVAQVDLVKLDIEGMEAEVLEPVLPYLSARRATLFVEVLTDTPRLRRLLVGMTDQGYRTYVIGSRSLVELSRQALAEADLKAEYGGWDVIAVPVEKTFILDERALATAASATSDTPSRGPE